MVVPQVTPACGKLRNKDQPGLHSKTPSPHLILVKRVRSNEILLGKKKETKTKILIIESIITMYLTI